MQTNGARNRALLIGTGWTLAMAVALALFKSQAFEPIHLWALGVVASGWAGALLYLYAAERQAAGAALAAADCETRCVVGDLALAMGAEMQRASMELARVDELLAHAIEQLMAAFNSVSDQAHRHQDELAAAAAAAAQGTAAAERLRAAAERVADDVNGAVTALQFRDVVGQKLGHVRQELEALELVLRQIRGAADTQCAPAAPTGRAELATRVQGLLRGLKQAKAASPAQQELMHAGEVELF